jgi:hypothetical protein
MRATTPRRPAPKTTGAPRRFVRGVERYRPEAALGYQNAPAAHHLAKLLDEAAAGDGGHHVLGLIPAEEVLGDADEVASSRPAGAEVDDGLGARQILRPVLATELGRQVREDPAQVLLVDGMRLDLPGTRRRILA